MGSWAGGLRAYGALSPPYVLIVIQNRSVTIYPVRSAFVWGWGGSLNPFYSCYYFFICRYLPYDHGLGGGWGSGGPMDKLVIDLDCFDVVLHTSLRMGGKMHAIGLAGLVEGGDLLE